MKAIFRLIVLTLLIAGWSLASLSLHVVRTASKIVVIPKQSLGYHDSYVDTRNWSMDDVANHPIVVDALIAHNKADVLQNVAPTDSADELVTDLKAAVAKGPVANTGGPTTQPSVVHEVKEAVRSHISV